MDVNIKATDNNQGYSDPRCWIDEAKSILLKPELSEKDYLKIKEIMLYELHSDDSISKKEITREMIIRAIEKKLVMLIHLCESD